MVPSVGTALEAILGAEWAWKLTVCVDGFALLRINALAIGLGPQLNPGARY